MESKVDPARAACLAVKERKEREALPATMACRVARETRATTAPRATPSRAPWALRDTQASPEIRDHQVAGGLLERLESAATKVARAPRELEVVPARARARAHRACRVSWVPRAS